MQLLEKSFTKNVGKGGPIHYNLLNRNNKAGIYSLRYEKNSEIVGYDVVIYTINPPATLFGKDYPERESFPTSENWGSKAWSFRNKDKAIQKHNAISQGV